MPFYSQIICVDPTLHFLPISDAIYGPYPHAFVCNTVILLLIFLLYFLLIFVHIINFYTQFLTNF